MREFPVKKEQPKPKTKYVIRDDCVNTYFEDYVNEIGKSSVLLTPNIRARIKHVFFSGFASALNEIDALACSEGTAETVAEAYSAMCNECLGYAQAELRRAKEKPKRKRQ